MAVAGTSNLAVRVAERHFQAVIRKEKGQFCVRSPNNPDWNGGCFDTKGEAEKRLKQVEFFKHKKAKRPVRINRRLIEAFVTRTLVPQIERWLKRQRQDKPIGALRNIASGSLEVDAVDGKYPLQADVQVDSKAATGKWAAVLGGSSGRYRWERGQGVVDIKLWLNGALTPADYLSGDPMTGNRLQSLNSCTHEHCLPYGLYSILTHEVTHTAESMFRQDPTYYRGPDHEVDEVAYVNDPGEVRAFMQQIVEEVSRGFQKLRDYAERQGKGNRELIDLALKLSTTWKGIEKHLSASNRAKILKAVYNGLDEAGLLF